ncbi:MAG: hypothetical protein ACKVQT_27555 [Burkholderiales bacterium]
MASQSRIAALAARSFALLGGEHNHYGAEQSDATGSTYGSSRYRGDGESVRFPEGENSSDYLASRLIEFLDAGTDHARPFFA